MPLASFSERRRAFRDVLSGNDALPAGSVFDATSARLAGAAGYRIGMFAGSVASAVVVGAPDLVVMTLTEFAEQAGRIARGSDLPFMVDADHGYGNALNVRRTVEELEAAGAAAIAIEDTVLPRPYAGPEGGLIPRDEFRDKLRSAVAARVDPALVIIGRTQALRDAEMDEAMERARICNEAGVDAVFLVGMRSIEEVKTLRTESDLPFVLNAMPSDATPVQAASLGVRLYLQGHLPYYAALNTLYESYKHLVAGGDQGTLAAKALSKELQAVALDEDSYAEWTGRFMGVDRGEP
jgi:carboxyvinyl-carboxyphosphonate phosphorylmutase